MICNNCLSFNFNGIEKCNRAVMLYKMLHSSIKYSPDPPSFQEYSSTSISAINAEDYLVDECCDPLKDHLSADIRAVMINTEVLM